MVMAPNEQTGYAYSVYHGSIAGLTAMPVRDPPFVDPSIEWEKQRCYEVRAGNGREREDRKCLAGGLCDAARHVRLAALQGLVGVGSEGPSA
jgi:hypothetical protein